MLTLLLLLLGLGSVFGALISQKPSRAIRQRGTSVMIECRQVDSQLAAMYWYRQLPGQSLVLMATANQGSKATYESGFTDNKFPISRPILAFSTLTVSNASSEDSSSYFCSARDTVLGTDQGSQQEPLSHPPSSQPGSVFGALVSQKPSRAIRQRGTSMTIECQVDSQLTWMYWYRQLPGQSLVLMATANQGSKATYESGFTEDKFPIDRPKLEFSTLTVSNASSEDSSSYFCSAGDTVLGTDQGSQQEPLSFPPSPRPACGISVPQSGIEPSTLLWKCGVLTTGSPGKSLCQFISVVDWAGNGESTPFPTFTGLTSCYPGLNSNTISPERAFLTFYAHIVPVDPATSYSHLLSLYPISIMPNH